MAAPMPAGCGPLQLLVIQPTPFCNLDCDYCYLPDRQLRQRLDLEVLELALERVLESPFVAGPFSLLWHAGEPLTMPMAFYDEATRLIEAALARHQLPAHTIQQVVQTNATVINAAWCDCLERNRIAVGVSLDGPAFLHDAHRRTRTGLGTHAATMRGIGWLQRRRIPFQVIAVLTSDSLDHAATLFHFFMEHGIQDVGFNMEETEGANDHSSLVLGPMEQRYRQFLEELWQLSTAAGGAFRCREFEAICGLAYSDSRLERTDMNRPFVIVNIDHQGHISTFDPELLAVQTDRYGDFIFGNVREHSLVSILETDTFQQVARDMARGVDLCRSSCDYFGLCGGGAGSNKYWEHGSLAVAETLACRYRIKAVADVVVAGLEARLSA